MISSVVLSTAAKQSWLRLALQLQGSVFPIVLPRILMFSGLGMLVALAHDFHLPVYIQALGDLSNNVACNLVLGLLLVFRTNTAYEKFWEGRKAWGELVVNIRNLSREIRCSLPAESEQDRQTQETLIKLLTAFAIATKLHLRQLPIEQELDELVSPDQLPQLQQSANPPLLISLAIEAYLQQQYQHQNLEVNQRIAMGERVNQLIAGLTSCERIARTPIPPAYTIYLKRLILIYCCFLPFNLVERTQTWTGLIMAVVSFILFGVEEIGNQIENPFGTDPNDLPLDQICQVIVENGNLVLSFDPVSPLLPGIAVSNPALPKL
uniref:Bestrophin-like protein n=1 Tax=Cyanothece sp. (strain PCC 7425 / ATCC 29141) TaxID=395961 RepID=B8HUV0_CYAP4